MVSTSSCPDDIGVVLLFQEFFEAAKNFKDTLYIPTIICKRGGLLGVAGLGYQWGNGGGGPKLRSVGESLLQANEESDLYLYRTLFALI